MAVRKHVIAAVGATGDELTAAFDAVGPGVVGEAEAAAWMTLSALRASAADVDAALDALGKPALRTTTVDGVYWELRLSGPGRESFTAEHHFALFDLDDLVLEEERIGELAERCGLAAWVDDPDADIAQDEVEDLLGFQADAIADALADFGFAFERREVVHVLSGVSVTKIELGWDTGNLPRLLETLGLGDAVEGWQDELAEEMEDLEVDAAARAELEAQPLARLRERLAGAELSPLHGEPVSLAVEEIKLLLDLAELCAVGFAAGFELEAADDASVVEALSGLDGPTTARTEGRLDVLVDDWASLWHQAGSVAGALGAARDGTPLEVMTASLYGDPNPAASQRYVGRLSEGAFHIEATYPAMSTETLTEALALVREGRAGKTLTIRGDDERDAVLAEVAEAIWFFHGPPKITPDGNRLTVARKDAVEGVVQYLFIRRHSDTWDVRRRAEWHRRQAAEYHG